MGWACATTGFFFFFVSFSLDEASPATGLGLVPSVRRASAILVARDIFLVAGEESRFFAPCGEATAIFAAPFFFVFPKVGLKPT